MLAGLDDAIKTGRARDGEAATASLLEQLAKWDRVVDSRPVVSLYQAFEDALWRRTFVDEMDEPLFLKFYEWAGAEKPAGHLRDHQRSQFAVVGRHHDGREARIARRHLPARDARCRRASCDGDFGGESQPRLGSRARGALQPSARQHRFPFRWFLSRGPVPVEGDGTTVMRISWNRLAPFAAWEYPSWRQLFDVGQWDDSRVVMPAGQSGHPMSPFYFDQNETWRTGPVSDAALLARGGHRRRQAPACSLCLKALAPALRTLHPALCTLHPLNPLH